jgi:hypothetical protein
MHSVAQSQLACFGRNVAKIQRHGAAMTGWIAFLVSWAILNRREDPVLV